MESSMRKSEVLAYSKLMNDVFSKCSLKVAFGEDEGVFYIKRIELDCIDNLGRINSYFDSRLFTSNYSKLGELLCRFDRLEFLKLSSSRSSSLPSLEPFSGLVSLKSLFASELASVDLSPLKSLSSLESLELYFSNHNTVDLSPLRDKSLSHLMLASEVLDVSPIADMTSLESLKLRIGESVDCSVFAELPKLTYFYLPRLADNSFVNKFVNLKNLECCKASSLECLSLPNLMTLTLDYCVDVNDFNFLYHCPSLTDLNLNSCGIVDLSKFGYARNLKKIKFNGTGLQSFSGFFNLPSIECFVLNDCYGDSCFPFLNKSRDGDHSASLNYDSFPELRAFSLVNENSSLVLMYKGYDQLIDLLKSDILHGRLNDLVPLIMLDSKLVHCVINNDLSHFSQMLGIPDSVLSDYYWGLISEPITNRAVINCDNFLKIRL